MDFIVAVTNISWLQGVELGERGMPQLTVVDAGLADEFSSWLK